MLLQLSEWQRATTSLSIATKRKRTKKTPVSKQCDNQYSEILPVAVSFVPPIRRPRPSKRRKGESKALDDVIPLLSVTASHGITVLGRSQSQDDQFQESTRMQYSSRPGKQSSFLPENSSDCSLHNIAALIKSDRVYALQNQNKVIVSWSSAGEGPDDATTAGVARLSLPGTAMSMGIIGKSEPVLYGTLNDGRCYVGFWATDTADSAAGGDSLKSHVFKSPHSKDGHHVSTIMIPVVNPGKSGGKRKATEPSDENFVLSQVFANKDGFIVVKYHLRVARGSVELRDNETSVSRIQVTPVKFPEVFVDPTRVLHSQDTESIAVMYQEVTKKHVINGKKTETETRINKICHFSLIDGLLKSDPFEVPTSTRHFGFVNENLLAVATIDSILFFEISCGILIRSINVSDVISDTKDWTLITDSKKGNVVLISAQPTHVHVAVANVSGKATDARRHTFTLADGLRASMISSSDAVATSNTAPTKDLLDFSASPKSPADDPVESQKSTAVSDALASISTCLDRILDLNDDVIKENSLLDAYENALVKLVPASRSPTKCNGAKHSKDKGKKGMNGKSPKRSVKNETTANRGETPPNTPQEFIDGAMTLVLVALHLSKTKSKGVDGKIKPSLQDAHLIMYQLIRTGKVSARRHFEVFSNDGTDADLLIASLRTTSKLTSKRGQLAISSVDLMHEMLSSCSDITERQLVTMIHYTLCKAQAENLAEHIIGWKQFDVNHPSKLLAEEFLRTKSEQLSAKILKVGLTFLVERIVMYSKPNEALLRTALTQGLANRCEAPTLARVLLDIIGQSDRALGRQYNEAATKWVFILCEACRETLSAESSKKKSHLRVILSRLQLNVEQNDRIMSLGPVMASARATLWGTAEDANGDGSAGTKTQKATKFGRVQTEKKSQKLTPYSIEQLTF